MKLNIKIENKTLQRKPTTNIESQIISFHEVQTGPKTRFLLLNCFYNMSIRICT